jgi:hypothetical protein
LTYLIEYIGEFEFIFETVLGYVSEDQMGYFEAKKTESKISRLGTFKCDLMPLKNQLISEGEDRGGAGMLSMDARF